MDKEEKEKQAKKFKADFFVSPYEPPVKWPKNEDPNDDLHSAFIESELYQKYQRQEQKAIERIIFPVLHDSSYNGLSYGDTFKVYDDTFSTITYNPVRNDSAGTKMRIEDAQRVDVYPLWMQHHEQRYPVVTNVGANLTYLPPQPERQPAPQDFDAGRKMKIYSGEITLREAQEEPFNGILDLFIKADLMLNKLVRYDTEPWFSMSIGLSADYSTNTGSTDVYRVEMHYTDPAALRAKQEGQIFPYRHNGNGRRYPYHEDRMLPPLDCLERELLKLFTFADFWVEDIHGGDLQPEYEDVTLERQADGVVVAERRGPLRYTGVLHLRAVKPHADASTLRYRLEQMRNFLQTTSRDEHKQFMPR